MTAALRRSLAFAAGAALSIAAGPARACDDRDRPVFEQPTPPAPPPAYAAPAYAAPAYAPPAYGPPAYTPLPRVWRAPPGIWRRVRLERAARDLRRDEAALEWTRERFYARWGWNPRAVSRFELWYAGRRADLERRWADLSALE